MVLEADRAHWDPADVSHVQTAVSLCAQKQAFHPQPVGKCSLPRRKRLWVRESVRRYAREKMQDARERKCNTREAENATCVKGKCNMRKGDKCNMREGNMKFHNACNMSDA